MVTPTLELFLLKAYSGTYPFIMGIFPEHIRSTNLKTMTNFDIIRNEGRLAYEYVRGSQLYGLNTPTSDTDTGGVYLCKQEELYGCFGYKPQVSDARHDNTWFEIGELVRLLMKSNPTVLETLFVPEDKIIGEVHPLMQMIIDHRDKFVTKQCFNPFFGYAKSQIEKARGLNKKIVNPMERRRTPMEFVYTFHRQGSKPFGEWLEERGLKQRYCGLVNVPNMRDMYGVYYDFGQHCAVEEDWRGGDAFLRFAQDYFHLADEAAVREYLETLKPIGYRGMFNEEKDSNEVRLSSIDKPTTPPICFVAYNQDAYSQHCRKYAEYQRWVKERNPVRYESNISKNYDSKNMMHMFRLVHMASEIAEGKGVILKRTYDHDFLMDVRNHRYEYDELIERLQEEADRMNALMAASTIPDKIDPDFVNDLLIEIRRRQFHS